jgi:hypothetical protein
MGYAFETSTVYPSPRNLSRIKNSTAHHEDAKNTKTHEERQAQEKESLPVNALASASQSTNIGA